MAAMSTKGPSVSSSNEAELLACRKALEFATDAGFSELVIEGDNVNVMKSYTFIYGRPVCAGECRGRCSSFAAWSTMG